VFSKFITDGNKCAFRGFKIIFWNVGVNVFADREGLEASGRKNKKRRKRSQCGSRQGKIVTG
jgi:hypothetical protein